MGLISTCLFQQACLPHDVRHQAMPLEPEMYGIRAVNPHTPVLFRNYALQVCERQTVFLAKMPAGIEVTIPVLGCAP